MTKKIILCASVLPVFALSANATPPSPTSDSIWDSPITPDRSLSFRDAWNADSEKSQYNLFNPTPRDQWRSFYYTDTPGISPVTTDAGAFNFRLTPLQYTYNTVTTHFPGFVVFSSPSSFSIVSVGVTDILRQYSIGTFGLKIGMLNNFDLEASWTPYQINTFDVKTDTSFPIYNLPSQYGHSDLFFRAKYNVLGNDGGPFAAALVGDLKVPTGSSSLVSPFAQDHYTGGPGLVADWFSPCGFDIRLNSLVSFEHSDIDFANSSLSSFGWNETYTESISATHKIIKSLYGYGGFQAQVSSFPDSEYQVIAKAGFLYTVTPDFNLFAEVDPSVHHANTYSVFFGLDYRFGTR